VIYYSHRTRKALAEGRSYLPLGFAHYSYGTVCRKFLDVFREGGLEAQELLMPEIYPSPAHLFPSNALARPLHIAFKPYEEIRLLKGAANVAHVAWEFDRLPELRGLPRAHPRRSNIMNDYVHMLGLASEVWVGSSYTKQVFEAHGINHVQVIPAPIAANGKGRTEQRVPPVALRRIGSLQLTRSRVTTYIDSTGAPKLDHSTLFRADDCAAFGGRVFLSIFNPGDPRKHAAALIMGFQKFIRNSGRNDLLIIKLVLDGGENSFRNALAVQLPRFFERMGIPFSFVDCANILLVPDRLSDEEMADLYRTADFYVCTSGAEGQGLPLQEAMAAGLVPISPAETAMADYINHRNAVVLATEDAPIPLRISEAYGLSNLSWRVVDHREVARGLAAAVEMPQDEYVRRSNSAAALIKAQYSHEHIISRVRERMKELVA